MRFWKLLRNNGGCKQQNNDENPSFDKQANLGLSDEDAKTCNDDVTNNEAVDNEGLELLEKEDTTLDSKQDFDAPKIDDFAEGEDPFMDHSKTMIDNNSHIVGENGRSEMPDNKDHNLGENTNYPIQSEISNRVQNKLQLPGVLNIEGKVNQQSKQEFKDFEHATKLDDEKAIENGLDQLNQRSTDMVDNIENGKLQAIGDEGINIKPKSTDENDIKERMEKLVKVKNQLQQLIDHKKDKEKDNVDGLPNREIVKNLLVDSKSNPVESFEAEYDLNNINNELISKLNQLPPFQERDRGQGYAIDVHSKIEVPNSVIRTLITKFLNQRFLKKDTDLNIRANSLRQTSGFHKWDIKAIITHLETHQLPKVLSDKYGYQYESGKNENVPLSFYFDMSGSMHNYTNILAVIAVELLKKDVRVLVGFNERINYQINSIEKKITVEELANALVNAGNRNEVSNSKIMMKKVNKNIDNYLMSSKAEKCVVFSDFDPLREVVNLSQSCNVYWFCFETRFEKSDLSGYKGFLYPVQNITDIARGLIKVNEYRFQALCYLDKGRSKTL
jgi:hypothetical protein